MCEQNLKLPSGQDLQTSGPGDSPPARSTYGGIPAELVDRILKQNIEIYHQKFQKLDDGKRSFNFCTFFFPFLWFAYRGLYMWVILSLSISCFFDTIAILLLFCRNLCFYGLFSPQRLLILSLAALAASLAFNILFGFLGDRIYLKAIARHYHNTLAKQYPGFNQIPDTNVLKEIGDHIEAEGTLKPSYSIVLGCIMLTIFARYGSISLAFTLAKLFLGKYSAILFPFS